MVRKIDFTFAPTNIYVVLLIYNFIIRLYVLGIRIASIRNAKAKEWINGRKNLFEELQKEVASTDKTIWFHCASAGEFEQGKPVIEELKKVYPSHRILVSFFSPSGYRAGKKYPYADITTYLPADTRTNAKRFIEIVKPQLVVFVKYEYWYHHLSAVAFHHIPLLMIASIFRKDQLFFKWHGRFYKQMLFLFRQLFVQDKNSFELLKKNNIHHCQVSGDTRFDRVKKIAHQFDEVRFIKEFIGDYRAIVAGSTWEQDEAILAEYTKHNSIKLVIAPHEIRDDQIFRLQTMLPNCVRYSELKQLFSNQQVQSTSIWNSINEQQEKAIQKKLADAKTLIVDTMGLLSKLYHYATITYVGGGFKAGIHNTLEAVVYGKPVVFGPKYQKFKEARDLIKIGAAFSVSSTDELKIKMDHLLNDPEYLSAAGSAAKNYVEENTGATQKILQYIQENRLLTN